MIHNIKDLERVLQKYIVKALELTRDEMFEIVSDKIVEYYNEPVFDNPNDPTQPVHYNRTGRMLESLSSSAIMLENDGYMFKIGWDDDYLTYHYPKGFATNRFGETYNNVTGRQVLLWMNQKSHGGIVSGEHNFWDEALMEIEKRGGFTQIFKRNCERVGIPLK